MKFCNQCNTQFLSKICPKCNSKDFCTNPTGLIKEKDTIVIKKHHLNIAGVIFLGIIASIMIYREYKDYREEQEIKKAINMTNEAIKPYLKMYEKSMKDIQKIYGNK